MRTALTLLMIGLLTAGCSSRTNFRSQPIELDIAAVGVTDMPVYQNLPAPQHGNLEQPASLATPILAPVHKKGFSASVIDFGEQVLSRVKAGQGSPKTTPTGGGG